MPRKSDLLRGIRTPLAIDTRSSAGANRRLGSTVDHGLVPTSRHASTAGKCTPCRRPTRNSRPPGRNSSRPPRTPSATPHPGTPLRIWPRPGSSTTAGSRSSSPTSTACAAQTSPENAAGRPQHRRPITAHQPGTACRAAAPNRRRPSRHHPHRPRRAHRLGHPPPMGKPTTRGTHHLAGSTPQRSPTPTTSLRLGARSPHTQQAAAVRSPRTTPGSRPAAWSTTCPSPPCTPKTPETSPSAEASLSSAPEPQLASPNLMSRSLSRRLCGASC